MAINFNKVNEQLNKSVVIDPLEIFMSLPYKNKKYSYLRNVQAEVLEQWHKQRDEKDNIIKMNTGSGKTTVALLILKSCLNEKKGHAVYVVPDNYLVQQVIQEANSLGIKITDSEHDLGFITGDSILVINIQKLFNGKSIFGMRTKDNIIIDYVLIDDVHACVDDVKSQFSIKISKGTELYRELFNLYKDDLVRQNEKIFLDLQDEDPCSASIMVPFWRMLSTKSDLLNILQKHKEDSEVKFNFPLLGDILEFCNCAFTYNSIEIEPYAVPIHKISSFCNASKRIFMSATLCDDSQLVSIFDLKNVKTAITPKQANDIGDRMILFPQAYSPLITDEDIRDKVLDYSKKYNIVVIVPSQYRAHFWKPVTDNIYYAHNIKSGIDLMKKNSNGLYVFVNKYDGIDLPDDACRIIILDGVPDARTAIDRIKETYIQGSNNNLKDKIQKIEQGMGRGIRSNSDYCGVIIMGAQLIKILYNPESKKYFSSSTYKQFEVSEVIATQLKDASIDDIFETLEYCVTQNSEWLEISKKALINVNYVQELKIDETYLALRKAFNLAVINNRVDKSKEEICKLVNKTDNNILKGYLMLEEAKYCNFYDPLEAQIILSSANDYNSYLLKPQKGINRKYYKKQIKAQAQKIIDDYSDKEVNQYIIDLNAVLNELVFAPNSYKKFEKSFANLASLLGWEGENITDGIGPDVLWYTGNLKHYVVECKNEAIGKKISKQYCEQLLSSVSWYHQEFPSDCKCVPIIIHPSNCFDEYASPAPDFRIINKECLKKLKENLEMFCKSISQNNNFKNLNKLTQLLNYYSFNSEDFINLYTTKYIK